MRETLIIGPAPGEENDLSFKPFVGPAGELLQRIIDAMEREEDA